MTRMTMLRLLESFFRRWWLCLLPVLLMAAIGARFVANQSSSFRSVGSVNIASSTLVATLTDVRGNPGFGYDTPAVATSKQVNSLLQTDQFLRDVVIRAGLSDSLQSGSLTLPKLRQGLTSWANGPNLLMVSGTFAETTVAQRLATSTIDAFVQSVVAANLGDSSAATSFFAGVLEQYQADVDAARSAVDTWLKGHPTPGFGRTRTDAELGQLKQLNDALTQATDRYNAALAKNDSARLSAEQTKSDVAQRLRVVDHPGLPLVPESGLKAKVIAAALFVGLGVLLAGAVVVMGAMSDRSVRFTADVKDRLGLRLLATVPDSGAVAYLPTKAQLTRMGVTEPRIITTARGPARVKPVSKATGTRKASGTTRKSGASKTRASARAKAASAPTVPVDIVPPGAPMADDVDEAVALN